MYIDSHCHLQLMEPGKIPESMENCHTHQVERMLCVSTHISQEQQLLDFADKFSNVDISLGIHPNETISNEPSFADYLQFNSIEQVVAIGETGLDYFREHDKQLQQHRFITQIKVANELQKPIIVHSREAKQDTIKMLKENHASKGVIHCFTEDWEMAQAAIDLNFYISFSGIVTFKNAPEIQHVAKIMPLDKMLIETDSPYLSPVPLRGKPNQPANVCHVARFIANLRNESLETVAAITTRNYYQLFLHNNYYK